MDFYLRYISISGNASDRVFVVDVDNYHEYSTNSLDRQAFSNPRFGLLESTLRSFSLPQDSPLLATKSTANSNEMNMNSKTSPCHFNRLTVRAMPDPVGFEQNCSYTAEHLEQSNFNSRNSLHNLMQIREDCTSSNSNQMELCSEEKNENLAESNANKLSPKVYSLNFPLKSVDDMGFCNTSVESVGWECTSCSTEELQIPSRHLMMEENRQVVGDKQDGEALEDDSESEVKYKSCLIAQNIEGFYIIILESSFKFLNQHIISIQSYFTNKLNIKIYFYSPLIVLNFN